MEKLVSCRHTEDGATREALKTLWLAGTDAVREPRYAVLLEQTYSVVGGLTVCGPGCALKLILGGMSQPHPSGPRPAVELLMRIMDNDECPEELLRWALGVASVEDVQEATWRLWRLERTSRIQSELQDELYRAFPNLAVDIDHAGRAKDELLQWFCHTQAELLHPKTL